MQRYFALQMTNSEIDSMKIVAMVCDAQQVCVSCTDPDIFFWECLSEGGGGVRGLFSVNLLSEFHKLS